MKVKSMNVKNMKETLVNYCGGDLNEFTRIWASFYSMVGLGFIPFETWAKFVDAAGSWTIDGDYLIDTMTGETIFDFDNGTHNNRDYEEYHA